MYEIPISDCLNKSDTPYVDPDVSFFPTSISKSDLMDNVIRLQMSLNPNGKSKSNSILDHKSVGNVNIKVSSDNKLLDSNYELYHTDKCSKNILLDYLHKISKMYESKSKDYKQTNDKINDHCVLRSDDVSKSECNELNMHNKSDDCNNLIISDSSVASHLDTLPGSDLPLSPSTSCELVPDINLLYNKMKRTLENKYVKNHDVLDLKFDYEKNCYLSYLLC
jgi:hypothetical protein